SITTAIALALISFSPTKWVNHFHAVAAAPTVLLAAALLRSPLPRRSGPVVLGASVLLLVGAVSLSFAGNNWWVPFSDAGQRFGNHLDPDPQTNDLEPHFGPLYLRNPLLWIGVAVAAWLVAGWLRRRGKLSRLGPDRAVLVSASATAVLLMLGLFAYAPIAQAPGWTVARSGFQTLFGDGCGLASDVRVQLPSGELGAPGPAELSGDFQEGPPPLRTSPWGEPVTIWHDHRPDGTTPGVGRLVTGWYPMGEGTHVTVPVAGRLEGQRLTVEFRTADGVVRRPLQPDLRRPTLHEWQQVAVPVPPRAEAVRVVAVDQVTGADSWLAVAEPKVTEARPVSEVTRGRPVLANHIAAPLWPCVDQVGISNGITDAPQVRLTTDEALPPEWLDNISYLEWGGAWVETSRVWTQTKLAAELPGGPPRLPWGHVFEVRYPYPTGQFDLEVDQQVRWGWTRLPSLADNDYPDIARNAGTQPEEEQEEKRPQIGNNGQLSPPDRRSRNGGVTIPPHSRNTRVAGTDCAEVGFGAVRHTPRVPSPPSKPWGPAGPPSPPVVTRSRVLRVPAAPGTSSGSPGRRPARPPDCPNTPPVVVSANHAQPRRRSCRRRGTRSRRQPGERNSPLHPTRSRRIGEDDHNTTADHQKCG